MYQNTGWTSLRERQGKRGLLPQHVLLVVNQRNPTARRVYEKSGFQVTAERLGSRGPQWIMTLPLRPDHPNLSPGTAKTEPL